MEMELLVYSSMNSQHSNFHKDIKEIMKKERTAKYEYDYGNCMLRQQIMRKEYDNTYVAQSCFGRKIDSKLSYL